jgi:hypothetical protein
MTPRSSPGWQRLAIAASIALVLGLAWWALNQRSGDVPTVADKENIIRPGKSTPPVTQNEQQQEPSAPLSKDQDGVAPAPRRAPRRTGKKRRCGRLAGRPGHHP